MIIIIIIMGGNYRVADWDAHNFVLEIGFLAFLLKSNTSRKNNTNFSAKLSHKGDSQINNMNEDEKKKGKERKTSTKMLILSRMDLEL